jgi:hypothetical protein
MGTVRVDGVVPVKVVTNQVDFNHKIKQFRQQHRNKRVAVLHTFNTYSIDAVSTYTVRDFSFSQLAEPSKQIGT